MIRSVSAAWVDRGVALIRVYLLILVGINAVVAVAYLAGAVEPGYPSDMQSFIVVDLAFASLLVVAFVFPPWGSKQPLLRVLLLARWCLAVGVFLIFQFGITVVSQTRTGVEDPGFTVLLVLGSFLLLGGLAVLPLDLMRLRMARESTEAELTALSDVAARLERQERLLDQLVEAERGRRTPRRWFWTPFFRGES